MHSLKSKLLAIGLISLPIFVSCGVDEGANTLNNEPNQSKALNFDEAVEVSINRQTGQVNYIVEGITQDSEDEILQSLKRKLQQDFGVVEREVILEKKDGKITKSGDKVHSKGDIFSELEKIDAFDAKKDLNVRLNAMADGQAPADMIKLLEKVNEAEGYNKAVDNLAAIEIRNNIDNIVSGFRADLTKHGLPVAISNFNQEILSFSNQLNSRIIADDDYFKNQLAILKSDYPLEPVKLDGKFKYKNIEKYEELFQHKGQQQALKKVAEQLDKKYFKFFVEADLKQSILANASLRGPLMTQVDLDKIPENLRLAYIENLEEMLTAQVKYQLASTNLPAEMITPKLSFAAQKYRHTVKLDEILGSFNARSQQMGEELFVILNGFVKAPDQQLTAQGLTDFIAAEKKKMNKAQLKRLQDALANGLEAAQDGNKTSKIVSDIPWYKCGKPAGIAICASAGVAAGVLTAKAISDIISLEDNDPSYEELYESYDFNPDAPSMAVPQ